MEKRKLIVISIDSMVTEDLEIIRQMPHMGKLLERSSIIRRNLTTYPSYTHSIHTSISTGCYPGNPRRDRQRALRSRQHGTRMV